MPVSNEVVLGAALALPSLWWITKILGLVLMGLYFVFTLIVIRQVNLMTEVLITEVSGFLRFLAILHSGLVLGLIILSVGLF